MAHRPNPDEALKLVLEPRERDLGDGLLVRRLLPAAQQRAIGPFVFFDHFGPLRLPAGRGMDVRPHPHINLATVTYLFEGEILHRDSLGSAQAIRPGDLNWMTAGRGIVHSERTAQALRAQGPPLHGLQLWVGLAREHEEAAPAFHHHAAETLPVIQEPGVELRVLVGEFAGRRSPVATFSRHLYLDVQLQAGASLELPEDGGERGVYVVDGNVRCGGRSFARGRLLVLGAGRVRLEAEGASRLVVVGGDPFPEPRHIWWNFVSTSEERLEQAKRDWRERRGDPQGPFPLVPGDEEEFIPLPEP
jgi:redox-sensitive bicupin YhaK (pirin superfamily)